MTALRILALWFLLAAPLAVVVGRWLAIASTATGGLPTSAGAVDGVSGQALDPHPSQAGDFTLSSERRCRVTGSEAGSYFVVVQDLGEWLTVGIPVGGGDGWVAGRWDTRAAAEADAERWTQLAAAVSS